MSIKNSVLEKNKSNDRDYLKITRNNETIIYNV